MKPITKFSPLNKDSTKVVEFIGNNSLEIKQHALVKRPLVACSPMVHIDQLAQNGLSTESPHNRVDKLRVFAITEGRHTLIRDCEISGIEQNVVNQRVEREDLLRDQNNQLLYSRVDNFLQNKTVKSLVSKSCSPVWVTLRVVSPHLNKIHCEYDCFNKLGISVAHASSTILKVLYFIILVLKYMFDCIISYKGLRFCMNRVNLWKFRFSLKLKKPPDKIN